MQYFTPLTSHSISSLNLQHVLFEVLNSVVCHGINPGEKAIVASASTTANADTLYRDGLLVFTSALGTHQTRRSKIVSENVWSLPACATLHSPKLLGSHHLSCNFPQIRLPICFRHSI